MSAANPASAPAVTGAASRWSTQRRRLLLVSYLAEAPFAPRGIRTRALLERFDRKWDVEVIAGPELPVQHEYGRGRRFRRLANAAARGVLLDKFELWSRRRLQGYRPAVNGAYLIGFPFSPLAYAARELAAAGTPYIVDIGDPWALTAHSPAVRGPALIRARRAERRVWQSASGAVVTTPGQADALRGLFPELPILVRPNGVRVLPNQGEPAKRRRQPGLLRLGHFGNFYEARLDVRDLLDEFATSGLWDSVEFHQYGSDWTGGLKGACAASVVEYTPLPWHEVIERAAGLDAVVVVGNRDPNQLPSKAVDYLTLPLPRIAITGVAPSDALAQYVANKPGWLVVTTETPDVSALVRGHVERIWTQDELAPPPSERWEKVSDSIADFADEILFGDAHRGDRQAIAERTGSRGF